MQREVARRPIIEPIVRMYAVWHQDLPEPTELVESHRSKSLGKRVWGEFEFVPQVASATRGSKNRPRAHRSCSQTSQSFKDVRNGECAKARMSELVPLREHWNS